MADNMALMAGFNSTGQEEIAVNESVLTEWNMQFADLWAMSEDLKDNMSIEFI
jgi:hypothetical protein